MSKEQIDAAIVAAHAIAKAIKSISHGDGSGPVGLEALVMALKGPGDPGGGRTITDGLFAISDAIDSLSTEIGSGLVELTKAIQDKE